MIKKITSSVLLILVLTSADAVTYHFFNSEKLVQAAKEWQHYQSEAEGADTTLIAEYAGYIGAIFDQESSGTVSLCIEEGTTKNQIIEAVSKFILREDAKLDRSAPDIVKNGLFREFSCN